MGGHTNRFSTNATEAVWAYNPQTDQWTNRAPLPTGRHYLGQCAVPLNGLIYLVGGTGAGNPGPLVGEVAVYNPDTDTWTNGAPMPTGRGNLAACAVDGIIYAIGGALDKSRRSAAVEAYDPSTDQWVTKAPMPQARWFVTASAVGSNVYVFHGNDVFIYTPQTDHWITGTNHFYPYSWGLMSAEVDGIIYLFGGMTQDWKDGNNFAFAYDTTTDRFTARRKMPHKRITSACGVIGGKVYLVAGASKEPLVNPDAALYTSMDIFDPQGGVTPTILAGTFETPNSFHLSWAGETGIAYAVESRTNPAAGVWTLMALPTGITVTATNSLVESTCTVPGGEQRMFFRVLEAN